MGYKSTSLKKVFIIFSCIFFPVAGFLAYDWWHTRQKADPFQLIPESAVAVIETTEFYNNWGTLQGSALWKNLQVLPFAAHFNAKMIYADSAAGGSQKLKSFFHGRKVISSIHVISNSEADCVFYIPVENDNDEEIISKIFSDVKKMKAEERTYGGITIKELTRPGQKKSFNIIRYRNMLIGSYTGFLIEDVIRIINEEGVGNFLKNNPEVKNSAHSHSDTYIYLDYKNISAFASLFANIQSSDFLKPLSYFAAHSVLDYKMGSKEILFDGFTQTKRDTHFLGVFVGQKPQKFDVKSFIPNNTGILYYYGFDDPMKLNESLIKFWQSHDPALIEKRTRMNDELGIDVNELYPEFGNEAALCFINSSKAFQRQGRLLFIESANAERFFLKLNKFVTIMKEGRKDTLLYEKLGVHLIREMNISELPSILLGGLFSGFEECYYTRINNYIVFSDDPHHLRELIINIDSENVWGKSAGMASFIDSHFSPSNISLFINTPYAWKDLISGASPEVKKNMQDNPELLKKISPVLFQFNVFQDKIYTNIVFNHGLDKELKKDQYKYEQSAEFKTAHGIASILHTGFSGNTAEVLLQDLSNILYLINNKNGVRWKDSIQAPVAGKAISADIDKDGVRDFILAAGNKIYSYDTAGKASAHFPIVLPDSVILSGLSLADYERDGNFRILVNDAKGNAYIFDANGKNLPGWNPKNLGQLTSSIRHLKVKGKDYFIAVRKDGKLSVLNRRGEMYKGFPVSLGKGCSSPVFIQEGSAPEKTFFHVLTDEGNLVKVDLLGSITEKMSLPDDGPAKYMLLPDQRETVFMVAMKSADQLMVMDPSGTEVFQMNISESDYEINYDHLREMNALTIYNKEENTSSLYLFDEQWKNIRKNVEPGRIQVAQMKNDIFLFKFRNNILEMGNIKFSKTENIK
jgi:hypothetical protein